MSKRSAAMRTKCANLYCCKQSQFRYESGMRSRIEPLKQFVKTVRNHRELLLNYFRAQKAFSSGIVEGLNNKAKVIMRKAYSYRTFEAVELSL